MSSDPDPERTTEEEIPARTYTVGDEIRLEVEVVCAANLETATAIFHREVYEPVSITLHGDIVLDEQKTPAPRKYHPALKVFRAVLVALVDRDHPVGTYRLGTVLFETVGGQGIIASSAEELAQPVRLEPVRFGIHSEHTEIESITARLIDPPASE